MLKKTIQFEDLDGNPVTEDFYFNLSKAEIAEMELSRRGGITEYLKEIVAAEDGQAIMDAFKEILSKAVGKRSEDGRRFVKNDELRDDFLQSDAYSEVFMEIITDPTAAAAFIRGVVPASLADKIDENVASTTFTTETVELPQPELSVVKENPPLAPRPNPLPEDLQQYLESVSPEQLAAALKAKTGE